MTDFEQAVMVEEMSRIYILCRLLGVRWIDLAKLWNAGQWRR